MLTSTQIKWASQHDWFVRANAIGEIVVIDRNVDIRTHLLSERVFIWKGTFRQLREWAGY